MTSEGIQKYLPNRQKRVHYAIKAKRLTGQYIPSSGPIEEGERILTSMHNQLINARAGQHVDTSSVDNLVISLASSSAPHKSLMIFAEGNGPRRRKMTARRIAYRLGLIPDRADHAERHSRDLAISAKQTSYTVNIAMDARVYGSITFYADSPKHALKMMTAQFVAKNFEPHGGSGDIDYDHPSDIVITECYEELSCINVDEFPVEYDVPDGPWMSR